MRDFRNTRLVASLAVIVGTKLFASFYDDILYPLSIAFFGLAGGIWMSVLAIFINYGLVMWYRRTEGDWFGFEAEREKDLTAALSELSPKVLKSRKRTFVLLATDDPAVAFVYWAGRKNYRLDRQDWKVFVLANTIGIGYWLSFLLAIYYSGGIISQRMADVAMYLSSAYGLYKVVRTSFSNRVTQG